MLMEGLFNCIRKRFRRIHGVLTFALLAILALLAAFLLSGCEGGSPLSTGQTRSEMPEWHLVSNLPWGSGEKEIGSSEANIYALSPNGSCLWVYDAYNQKLVRIDLRRNRVNSLSCTQNEHLSPSKASVRAICTDYRGRLHVAVQEKRIKSLTETGGRNKDYEVLTFGNSLSLISRSKFTLPDETVSLANNIAVKKDGSIYVYAIDNDGLGEQQCLVAYDRKSKKQWEIFDVGAAWLSYTAPRLVLRKDNIYMQDQANRLSNSVDINTLEENGELLSFASFTGYDFLGIDDIGNVYVANYDKISIPEKPVFGTLTAYGAKGDTILEEDMPAMAYPSQISHISFVSNKGVIFFVSTLEDDGFKVYAYR